MRGAPSRRELEDLHAWESADHVPGRPEMTAFRRPLRLHVVVHPAGNSSVADGCARYRDLLVNQSTFSSMTLEELFEADALPPPTAAALRERFLPG